MFYKWKSLIAVAFTAIALAGPAMAAPAAAGTRLDSPDSLVGAADYQYWGNGVWAERVYATAPVACTAYVTQNCGTAGVQDAVLSGTIMFVWSKADGSQYIAVTVEPSETRARQAAWQVVALYNASLTSNTDGWFPILGEAVP